MLDLHFATKK